MSMINACSLGKVEFLKTSELNFKAKEDNCDFRVYSTPPSIKYGEIGIVSIPLNYAQIHTSSIIGFKKESSKYVCAYGGDAIIGVLNGYGFYISGTIIKMKEDNL